MNLKWPLNDNQFTFLDKLRICLFFLNKKNKWTQGEQVRTFEKEMGKFCNSKYTVFVSSGSTANTLVAMYVKDKIFTEQRNIVVLPSVTWQTSCSPWIREGFKPHFIDISLNDFSMDLIKLESYLEENKDKVAAVFVTSLLGFSPDINHLIRLQEKYPFIKFALDNCESNLTKYNKFGEDKNLSHYFTSTTSTYFGHEIQSVEGGFIFTNDKREYGYFLKARNHGMTRALLGYEEELEDIDKEIYYSISNPTVDSRFDFNILGNNFRNSDVNAFIGRLDLKRASQYEEHRSKIYNYFCSKINSSAFILPKSYAERKSFAFTIPIILNSNVFKNSPTVKKQIIKWCDENGIETRPIISGNLLRQTCYQKYANFLNFPVAEKLHSDGFYVGLYSGVSEKMVYNLVDYLNKVASEHIK